MLKHSELKKGKIIIFNNAPYEIVKHSHVVKGRGRSVVQAQLKNISNGRVLQKTFHAGEEIEEAELEKLDAIFSHSHRGKFFFYKKGDPSSRFTLTEEELGEKINYLTEKTEVVTTLFNEKIIGITLPIKMTFRVKEAPPGIRGDRAEGGTKFVVIETGKSISTPLFIEEGDLIEINTESGEYIRRV